MISTLIGCSAYMCLAMKIPFGYYQTVYQPDHYAWQNPHAPEEIVCKKPADADFFKCYSVLN